MRVRYVGVDTETALIYAGRLAPPLSCGSFAERGDDGVIDLKLLNYIDAVDYFEALLLDPCVVLIFHNGPFDLCVFATERPELMPLIFRAMAANRIADTQTREQLIMIARGDMAYSVEQRDEDDEGDDEDESPGWKRVKKQYTLAGLTKHYLRRELDKDDGPRLTYGALRYVPIDLWSPRQVSYAKDDAGSTLEVFEAQAPKDTEGNAVLTKYVSPDERMQVGAAFALHLAAVHGVRTDAEAIDVLETRLLELQQRLGERLVQASLVRPKREKGVVKLARNMAAIRTLIAASFTERTPPLPVPYTDPSPRFPQGQISTAKETIEAAASFPYPEGIKADDHARYLAGLDVKIDDTKHALLAPEFFDVLAKHKPAALEPLVAFAQTQKILGTYVRPMKLGVTIPMNSRPNVLVETGRTSWGAMTLKVRDEDGVEHKVKIGANLQNFPRMPGVRDCIIARPGTVFASVDYESIELRTLAQSILRIVGRSTLARRYQADPSYDPHTAFAARMMGVTYAEGMRLKAIGDKKIKRYRQLAKAPNFGYPGGMGSASLVSYAWKSYGLRITLAEAVELREIWFAENPEMREYFSHVTDMVDLGGTFRQIGSGRIRGKCGFCDGCNGYFQGLAADGGKAALFAVAAEMYADPLSPLFGCRTVAFIHDEIFAEVHEATAHECAMRIVEIMEREMQRFVPDVPVRAAPALCRRWLKSAEAHYVDGRLVPWDDHH